MILKAENFYIEFSPGMYLDTKGKIVDKLPATDYSVGRLPVQFNLPSGLKSMLNGVELGDVNKVLKDASPLLTYIGIDKQLGEIIGASINLLIALASASVSGTVGAATTLLQALGVMGGNPQQNLLTSIYQIVQNDYELQKKDLENEFIDRVLQVRGTLEQARWGISDYISDENISDDDTERLRDHINSIHSVLPRILSPQWQQSLFIPSSFSVQPWYRYVSWLDLHPDATFDPGFEMRGVDLKRTSGDKVVSFPRWDYIPYTGIVFETISALLVAYKALDPAYRTTRRFEGKLKEIARGAEEFGNLIVKHILWTREWDEAANPVWDYVFAEGWLVGAVNACSGASAITMNWNEGIETTLHPTPLEPVSGAPLYADKLFVITNMAESLERARRKRYVDWLTVLESSGALKVLQMAELLSELSTVPALSETVETFITAVAKRTFLEKRDQEIPADLGCDQATFVAAVHLVERKVTVHATLQSRRYQDAYTIPYTFALESYTTNSDLTAQLDSSPLDRVELKPGTDTITLHEVTSFDWEVKSSQLAIDFSGAVVHKVAELSQDKYVQLAKAMPEIFHSHPLVQLVDISAYASLDPDLPGIQRNITRRPITDEYTLEYTLTLNDGEAIIQFSNLPEEGNSAGVFLVIEEKPKGMDSKIRTLIDVSMIGTEYHLPPAYFDYIAMCETKTRMIIKEIEHQFHLKGEPIPPWDSGAPSVVHEWAQQVLTEHPNVLEGELLQQAKLLTKPGNF